MRRFRLLLLTQLLVLCVVQLAPAQGQFKYRIDRSRDGLVAGSGNIEPSKQTKQKTPELWFGRPRSTNRSNGDRVEVRRESAGVTSSANPANIPWKKQRQSQAASSSFDLLELPHEQIVVEDSRIRIDDDGNYLIDVHARIVGQVPREFVTVAGLTNSGDGFARSRHEEVGDFLAWKKIERLDSQYFLMSFSLPSHFSMRRYQHYLVKFYDANGFDAAQVPRD